MHLQDNPLTRLAAACSTAELRQAFLVSGLFQPGEVRLRWWETDRTVLGAAVPLERELALPSPLELRSEHFLERREAGIVNVGARGAVTTDGIRQVMEAGDALYLGRGGNGVTFASEHPGTPARFWIVSYPAHATHPRKYVPFRDAVGERLGTRENANERTLFRLIHPGTVPTCQLVMGLTRLEPGSVWNSMPPHTHLRRSEVYLYYNLPPGQAVFHFMGEPAETRHLVVRDAEAVLSPPWSVHCGAGTCAYSFVWCMGGENQAFADMDPAPIGDLR
jgi:4-deoxy-L-threo-5-hexosulose-uronate ketol-isomerase